ncbi:conjugal transfer protein [Streptomyces sp. NPDC057438]|uniref:conjugal transfer protein n=1 Tax=Streptomyces sp. NPDC057438 TaxID=3346133 RepID=UPI00369E9AA0
MTDHNSPAGAVGGGQPTGQPGSFGPPQNAQQQHQPQQPHQPQQQAWQAQGQNAPAPHQGQSAGPHASHPQPQQLPSDAARAQVAAAWVRNTPQAGQAAVPALPPRETRPASESKKEKRERERAARKAAYEQKKAAKEQRKKGGAATGSAALSAPPAVGTLATPHAAAPTTTHQSHAPGNARPALRADPAGATGATAGGPSASAKAGPARDFAVPRPGGRIPAGGRGTHVALRATLLITTCVFALGSCGVMGLVIGKSSTPATAGLDPADAAKFRLSEFPTRQAATFAEQYAMLCMTYSPETASTRRDDLARYTSSGVDGECGWDGKGTNKAVAATWDGTAETLPEYGDHGRYLGVQVRSEGGKLTTLTVPVYVKDLGSGEGMRVAGDVGQMPLPPRADVPPVDQDAEVVDDTLSDQLREQVLPGYFKAWGASDTTAMDRFTTSDATQAATTGLSGELSDPTVSEVDALVPKNVQGTDPYAYSDGQAVQLRVVVAWTDPAGGAVNRSYRMTVVSTAQGWFIRDVRGGVLDAEGGRADVDEETAAPDEDSAGDEDTAPDEGGTASPSPSASKSPRSSKDKQADKS